MDQQSWIDHETEITMKMDQEGKVIHNQKACIDFLIACPEIVPIENNHTATIPQCVKSLESS